MIVLIGYRATGKTTVARVLAERLGWNWIDADVELETRAGKSIADIFRDSGEQAFRDLESAVIAELVQRERLVIATGGGVVLREQNRQALQQAGQIVWLRARLETILSRLAGDASTAERRPNLTNQGGAEEVRQLLEQREPIYRALAQIAVDTDDRNVDDIVSEIIQKFPSP